MATPLPNPPSLDLILGPILMGTVVNVFLFGIMVVQCYLYFMWYKKDRTSIKLTVVFLLVLDTVGSAFDVSMTYQYLVSSFGNLQKIGIVNVGISTYPILSGITCLAAQFFFAWRISTLTGRNWTGVFICFLSVVQMLASFGTAIGGIMIQQLSGLSRLKAVALTWLVTSAVNDILITTILVFYLRTRRTGFSSTDDLISRVVRSTVQTGVVTSACAIGVAVAYLVSNSSLHLGFGIPMSKLYTNSLMSTLNMRQNWNSDGFADASLAQRQEASAKTHPQPHVATAPHSVFYALTSSQVTSNPDENYEMERPAESRQFSGVDVHVVREVKTDYIVE